MFVTIEALNWRWKTTYPQTRFRKTAIQKVRFLGHPVADGDDDNDVIVTHADQYQSYNEN